MDFDPGAYLQNVGFLPDRDIDIANTAIYLAALGHPGRNLESSFNHLKKISQEVAQHFNELLDQGDGDSLETRLVAMRDVLNIRYEYTGNAEDYDNLSNADLIHVMDTRRGLPIALCIIYIHVARALGWGVSGISIPGHYLCRMEKDGRGLIFDPFYDCGVVEAPQIRALIKKLMGPEAELRPEYFEPASNREILARLQNNIKLRQLDLEDYEGAIITVENMLKIDPNETRYIFDLGVLYSKVGQPMAAIKSLQEYINESVDIQDIHDAQILMQHLKDSLN